MATLHIIEGPVGAGKTTYANTLGHSCRTSPLVLDAWMVTLFRPDRPSDRIWEWYAERKLRCIEQIWQVASGLLDAGQDAIVELGLLKPADRAQFYARLDATPHRCCLHVLDAPREERWQRVQQRNLEQGTTFAMVVSREVFEVASDMWQAPDAAECSGRDVRFVSAEQQAG